MFTTYLVFALSLTASTSALVTPHAPRNAHTHHAIAARVASPVPVAPLVTKKSLRKRCVARNSTASASASVSSILSSVVASSTPTVVNVAPVPVISSTEAAPTTTTKTKAATTSTKAATTSTKAAATSTKTTVSSTKVAATSTEATPTSTKVETSTLLVPSTTSSTHTTTKHSTTSTTTQIPTTSTTTHTPTTTTTKHTSTSSSTSTTAATKTTAASSSSSTEPSFMIGTQTGQGTYYGTGLGACGITNSDTDYIAAASELLFDTFPGYNGLNPNNNPICGLKVKATYEGKSVTVAITDRCTACAITDLDFSPTAFNQIADPTVGRISGMTWVWV